MLTLCVPLQAQELPHEMRRASVLWTEANRIQLIELVTKAEIDRQDGLLTRREKWAAIRGWVPPRFKTSCQRTFVAMRFAYLRRRENGPPKQRKSGPGILTEAVLKKFDEYEERVAKELQMGEHDDGFFSASVEILEDEKCGSSTYQDARSGKKTPSPSSLRVKPVRRASTPPLKKAKRFSSSPSSKVLNAKSGGAPLKSKARRTSDSDHSDTDDGVESGDSLARQARRRSGKKMKHTYDGDKLFSSDFVEELLKRFSEQHIRTSLYLEKLLKGLPDGKAVIENLEQRAAAADASEDEAYRYPSPKPNGGGFYEKLIEEHKQKRVHLLIRAIHEELQVQMTELIKQTAGDLSQLLLTL